jgi:membrane-anchored protein YejM (alkaline phosphatase superfamily)
MKTTTLNEIKKELQHLQQDDLVDLCLSLAKYKKDNKEYVAYLLFQAQNKTVFLNDVKAEIDDHFLELSPQTNLYYIKKSLRKLLRTISKFSKYLGDKALSVELYMYFCRKLKNSGIPFEKSPLLVNMYQQQLKKINSLVGGLHEDLQSDYHSELEKILI